MAGNAFYHETILATAASDRLTGMARQVIAMIEEPSERGVL
jgi:hypothetical protein